MAFSRSRRSQSTGNFSKQSRGQTRRKDETSEESPTGAKNSRSRKPFQKTGTTPNRQFSGSTSRGSSQNRRTGDKPRLRDFAAGGGEFSERRERNTNSEKPRSSRSFISERPRTSNRQDKATPYGSRPKSRSNSYERSEQDSRNDNPRSATADGVRSPRKPNNENPFRDRSKIRSNSGERSQRGARYGRPSSTRSASGEGTRTYRKPSGEKPYRDREKIESNAVERTQRDVRGKRPSSTRSASGEGTRTYKKTYGEKSYSQKQKSWGEKPIRSSSRRESEFDKEPRVKLNRGKEFDKENAEFIAKPKILKQSDGETLKPTRTPLAKKSTDSGESKEQSPKQKTDRSKQSTGQKSVPRKTQPGIKARIKAKRAKSENLGTRINKYLADSGVGSRRAVEELISKGEVKVNRIIVTDLSTRIMPGDFVTVNGEPITDVRRMIYILLNKPKDVITTADDEFGRKTVLDLIKTDKRLFPVGRLDRNTTGVLLLTNDGELAHRLTHPSYAIPRVYNVTLNEPLEHSHARQIANGVVLDDGEETQPCEVFIDPTDGKKLILELREGKNREVRRIFEKFGYDVRKLDRKFFATLSTRGLARGKYRVLTRRELSELRQLTGLE